VGIEPCATSLPIPGVVTFDPDAFAEAFPAFASVPAVALEANFQFATQMLDNSCCSPVCDANTRANLLNLITAHITALLNGVNGQPPQGVVGRINAATEGSVSVQTEMLMQKASAAYWNQTQWGALYWRMSAQFRLSHYFPAHRHSDAMPWDAWPQ
jgi:DNA-binding transcriptional regulator YdaS (Cro superfamily)